MPPYTVILNTSQEDALKALLDDHLLDDPESTRTLDEQLNLVLTAALAPTEAAIARLFEELMKHGRKLPQHIRARITEGLTPEQLDRLSHVRPATPRVSDPPRA